MAARFNRINRDGRSSTVTALAAADILPGTLARLSADGKTFTANATAGTGGALYAIGVGSASGLQSDTAIPAGDSAVGDRVDPARTFALLVAAGTVLTIDAGLTTTATGTLALAGVDDVVVGYSKEARTVGATAELNIVRIA